MGVSRRDFLHAVGAASVCALSAGPRRLAAATARVDGAKLRQRIEALSAFGRPPGGSFGDGVSRVAYSDADIAGRAYVIGLMKAVGLEPRIDPAGNIFGRRQGADPSLQPILFGSHIDSVPNGGNFDGDLGSLSALGVMETLDRSRVRTRHPLEMVVWAHEEGVAFDRGLACSRTGRIARTARTCCSTRSWSSTRRSRLPKDAATEVLGFSAGGLEDVEE